MFVLFLPAQAGSSLIMREGGAMPGGEGRSGGEGATRGEGRAAAAWRARGPWAGLPVLLVCLLVLPPPARAFTLRDPPQSVPGHQQGPGEGRELFRREQGGGQLERGGGGRGWQPVLVSSRGPGSKQQPLSQGRAAHQEVEEGRPEGALSTSFSDASLGPGQTGRSGAEGQTRGAAAPGDAHKFPSHLDAGPWGPGSVTLPSPVAAAAEEGKEREKKEFRGFDLSSRPQALLQEVSKSGISEHQVPKMVVGVVSAVAGLFGLCVLAALFQCCCRKKRSTTDSQDQDQVKETQGSLPHTRTPSPEPLPPEEKEGDFDEEDRKSESHRLLGDELGDFSAVQRETEILKSFRKPPPPKNRGKATRAARQKPEAVPAKDDFFPSLLDAEASEAGKEPGLAVDVASKRASMELLLAESLSKDRGKGESEEGALIPDLPHPARKVTPPRDATTPPRGERTPPRREETPQREEPNASGGSDRPSSLAETFANGGNIFMQIDPTVKRSLEKPKSGSKIPVTVRRSTVSPTESPVMSPLVKPDRRSPQHPQPTDSSQLLQPSAPSPSLRPGAHRKFLVPSVHGEQMDELLKSLKTRLQEEPSVDSTSISSQNKSQDEDGKEDMEPQSRDRSFSDSDKHKRQVKQTDL